MDDLTPRQRAGRVGAVARIAAVSLHHLEFDLGNPAPSPPFSLNTDMSVGWTHSHPLVVFDVGLQFAAFDAEAEGDEVADAFFHGVLGLFVVYELPEDRPEWDEADFEAFANISATFAAWPYIREILQSLTSRAGIPPLVLDVLRAPLEATPAGGPDAAPPKKAAAKKSSGTRPRKSTGFGGGKT